MADWGVFWVALARDARILWIVFEHIADGGDKLLTMNTQVARACGAVFVTLALTVASVLLFSYAQNGEAAAGALRWIHIGSAVLWLGGSALGAAVYLPLSRRFKGAGVADGFGGGRYAAVNKAVVAIVAASGVMLALDAIVGGGVGLVWMLVMVAKLAVVVPLFYAIFQTRSERVESGVRGKLTRLLGYDALLAVGVLALLATSLLRFI